MIASAEEIELARRDFQLFGFSMLHEGKRVPPEQWDDVFASYPGIREGNEAGDSTEETWHAIIGDPPESSQL